MIVRPAALIQHCFHHFQIKIPLSQCPFPPPQPLLRLPLVTAVNVTIATNAEFDVTAATNAAIASKSELATVTKLATANQ